LLGTVWERGYREIDSVFKARPYPDAPRTAAPGDSAVRTLRLSGLDSVDARLRRLLVDTVSPQPSLPI
jgi:hypothetical protein